MTTPQTDDRPSVLFISYDGLTDPLGTSQVIPYVQGLARLGYRFTILSCDKPHRYRSGRTKVEALLAQDRIEWVSIGFRKFPPLFSKIWNLFLLKYTAMKLQRAKNFSMVHCRSYLPVEAGLKLKDKYRLPVLFDMRGFWPDERVDAGIWNLKNPFYRWVYSIYKKKEAQFIQKSDALILLSEAGQAEILKWPSYSQAPIKVIPCAVNFQDFHLVSAEEKNRARQKLKIDGSALVLAYLGSLGAWYMLDEMLMLFRKIKNRYPTARFLILTPDSFQSVHDRRTHFDLKADDFIMASVDRSEVPQYLAAADLAVSFIRSSYSKIASCPTKLGEFLALGLPVITNSGIGDVERIIAETGGGLCLQNPQTDLDRAVDAIPSLVQADRAAIREKAGLIFDMERAIGLYSSVYEQLLSGPKLARPDSEVSG